MGAAGTTNHEETRFTAHDMIECAMKAFADGKAASPCWNCGEIGHLSNSCPLLQQGVGMSRSGWRYSSGNSVRDARGYRGGRGPGSGQPWSGAAAGNAAGQPWSGAGRALGGRGAARVRDMRPGGRGSPRVGGVTNSYGRPGVGGYGLRGPGFGLGGPGSGAPGSRGPFGASSSRGTHNRPFVNAIGQQAYAAPMQTMMDPGFGGQQGHFGGQMTGSMLDAGFLADQA